MRANKILRWLDKIEEINTQISEICDKEDIDINDDSRQSDMQNEQLYCSQMQSKLSTIASSGRVVEEMADAI